MIKHINFKVDNKEHSYSIIVHYSDTDLLSLNNVDTELDQEGVLRET